MEPLTQSVKRYKFRARVAQVEQRFRKTYVRGFGEIAEFTDQSMGYYVRFVGSWEALFVGFDPPNLARDDKVTIWVEKDELNNE
jgi:hypothetical protein